MLKFPILLTLISLTLGSHIINQQFLTLTIYNNNFALVKDTRKVYFDEGLSTLYFTDVTNDIQPKTVSFKVIDDPNSVQIFEQNFQKNVISRKGILQKYIEKDVVIYADFGDISRGIAGKLLGFNQYQGYIIQTQNKTQILTKISALQFSTLPPNFFTKPTLTFHLKTQTPQTSSCEISYRTIGFRWKSDYLIILNKDDSEMDIGGWITIDNFSTKNFVDVKLKLIAGDVNIAKEFFLSDIPFFAKAQKQQDLPLFIEKPFSDYHMYTLQKPTTLNSNSQKQIQFLPKIYNIPIDNTYQIDINDRNQSQFNIKPKKFIRFNNSKEVELGVPLPKGTVRVFKRDPQDEAIQYIGQDRIQHTPKNQNLTIKIGNSYDLLADKFIIQESKTIKDKQIQRILKIQMKITNYKQMSAQVIVNQNINWNYRNSFKLKMIQGSDPQIIAVNLYRWKKILQPKQVWTIFWEEVIRQDVIYAQ